MATINVFISFPNEGEGKSCQFVWIWDCTILISMYKDKIKWNWLGIANVLPRRFDFKGDINLSTSQNLENQKVGQLIWILCWVLQNKILPAAEDLASTDHVQIQLSNQQLQTRLTRLSFCWGSFFFSKDPLPAFIDKCREENLQELWQQKLLQQQFLPRVQQSELQATPSVSHG